ncbi:MAG TPA: zinc-ribbon domain-containing protein [Alphaproteobacteria bacterium]
MKVICPECSAEYDVPVPLLGEAGRRVRCSSCGHIWIPDLDMTPESNFGGFRGFDENMDIEPIPSSVHPDDDDGSGGHEGPGFFAGLNYTYLGKLLAGFGLACLFIAIFLGIGVAVGLNKGVLRPLFTPFGLAGEAVKSPLVIQDVTAKASQDAAGQPILSINGKIHNGGTYAVQVPQIEITLLGETGLEGDSLQVEPSVKSLDAGQDVTFSASMQGGAAHGDKVKVRFIP